MATLYFNSNTAGGGFDGDWSNPSNWWSDDLFTIPAGVTPIVIDDAIINDSVLLDTTGLASAIGVNECTFRGGVTFDPNGIGLTLTTQANAQFYDSCANYGNIANIGNAAFHDSSFNGGTATGNATFNDSSFNGGTAAGGATFNDSSFNTFYATVIGDATFNDSSFNSGLVTGNATFNNSSFNNSGLVTDATFNDSSYNQGTVSGNATFNGPYLGSRVGGTYNGQVILNMTCPASAGSDQTIARLLNLPFFINL